MRVLFTSTRGLGHLHPLLPLARAARSAGCDVLFAVPESSAGALPGYRTAFTVDGFETPAAGAVWAGLASAPEPNTYMIAAMFGRLLTSATLEPTGRIVEEFQPDLVLSDYAEFAGGLHAERLGIRWISVAASPLDLPGFDPAPLVRELDALRGRVGLAPVGRLPWERVPVVTWLPRILTGRPGLIRYRYEDPEGPIAVTPEAAPPRPRIYATLGSAAGRTPFAEGAYRALLEALGRLDADVLLTTGSGDPERFGPVPGNVRMAPYVPQAEAMRCDAVIAHGGSGTTVAALARGLPQVIVPLFADQPHNAASVEAAGAGLTVDVRAIGERLPAAVEAVLGDPAYRAAAGRVAEEIRATPDADAVFARISAAVPV